MFSHLDPLFRTSLRHAESTDTRQGIRRDEEKPEQRSPGGEKREDESPVWEDRAEVSVKALVAFLESLIGGQVPAKSDPATAVEVPQGEISANNQEGGSPAAARAAGAYRDTALRHADAAPVLPPADKTVTPAVTLTPAEQRIIHQLLADLRILQENRVAALTIRRSDSFLQSLKDAVLLAKS